MLKNLASEFSSEVLGIKFSKLLDMSSGCNRMVTMISEPNAGLSSLQYLIERVYPNRPESIEDLNGRIRMGTDNLQPQTIRK